MGVDISSIVPRHEKTLGDFKGKSIAIDAFNALYQFLASIRQPDGTPLKDFNGNITSHLSGLFYRTINLIENGITPVYVFDGEPPEFKRREIEERKERKKEYELLEEKAKDLEDEERMRSYASAMVRLTKEEVKESKELLEAMGVAYVEAISEGEAEAAYLARKGKVYASSSQDYDSLLFGAPKLIRNLSISGKRKLPRRDEYVIVRPEEISLEETLSHLGITREQLIMIGLLVGTDFNKGVKGIGPKKALALVKRFKDLKELKVYVKATYKHEFEDYIEEVFNFFLNPPVIDAVINEGKPNEEKIIEILVERHDFSEERVRNALRKMKEALERRQQSSLSEWF